MMIMMMRIHPCCHHYHHRIQQIQQQKKNLVCCGGRLWTKTLVTTTTATRRRRRRTISNITSSSSTTTWCRHDTAAGRCHSSSLSSSSPLVTTRTRTTTRRRRDDDDLNMMSNRNPILITIGIAKETYNIWERRTPLTPQHVKELLHEYNNNNSNNYPINNSSHNDNIIRLRVLVESSLRRIYNDHEYENAGAIIVHNNHNNELLSSADIILNVKRPFGSSSTSTSSTSHQSSSDVSRYNSRRQGAGDRNNSGLYDHCTHLMFSHTMKGQMENMTLLNECIQKNIQLIDYERILVDDSHHHHHQNHNNNNKEEDSTTDLTKQSNSSSNSNTSTSTTTTTAAALTGTNTTNNTNNTIKPQRRRYVTFGKYAGIAGAIDTIHMLGRTLLYKYGMSTPFLSYPSSSLHNSIDTAIQRLRTDIGQYIQQHGYTMPTTTISTTSQPSTSQPSTTSTSTSTSSRPLVIAVTGRGKGSVYSGVMSILQTLPHEIVTVHDLPTRLLQQQQQEEEIQEEEGSSAEPEEQQQRQQQRQRSILIVPVGVDDIMIKKKQQHQEDIEGTITTTTTTNDNDDEKMKILFDRNDYENNPSSYKSTFAIRVVPYVDAIINCVYWDARYPRLLSKKDLQHLYQQGYNRLSLVSDISCDINGSMEFLHRTTTIEQPYFYYHPILQKEIFVQDIDNMNNDNNININNNNNNNDSYDDGVTTTTTNNNNRINMNDVITVLGVDILPTELPRESSIEFGNAVKCVVRELINARAKTKIMEQQQQSQSPTASSTSTSKGIDMTLLSPGLADACITTSQGTLTPGYRYLQTLMERALRDQQQQQKQKQKQQNLVGIIMSLEGHLFDSGLINQIMDIIEDEGCGLEFQECIVQPNSIAVAKSAGSWTTNKSSVVLKIFDDDGKHYQHQDDDGGDDVDVDVDTAETSTTTSASKRLTSVESKIQKLVHAVQRAEATVSTIDRFGGGSSNGSGSGRHHHRRATGGNSSGSSKSSSSKHGLNNNYKQQQARGFSTNTTEKRRRVLLLGSGYVSKSAAEYLSRQNISITVVSDNDDEAREVVATVIGISSADHRHVACDIMNDRRQLADLISECDVVISLVPAPIHPIIAEECIIQHKDMITASYESDEMRSLEHRAIDAGIVILNEVGLDPGLDHMSAMKIINDIHDRGGRVHEFVSVCGGLPSPDCAMSDDNPLRYKFSWSPRGVLRACQNDARYRWKDDLVHVDGEQLLQSATAISYEDCWPDLHLECIPNRDSLKYEHIYGIQEASTLFRGTLRYHGFSSLMSVFQNMGLLDESISIASADMNEHSDWIEILRHLGKRSCVVDIPFDEIIADFVRDSANNDDDKAQSAMDALRWLGMLDRSSVNVSGDCSVLDAFCQTLEQKLQYKPHERDMVVMHHTIRAVFDGGGDGGESSQTNPDGTTNIVEIHESSLRVHGDDKMSAMAKTVGYTVAAGASLLLLQPSLLQSSSSSSSSQSNDNSHHRYGLLLPTTPEVYNPILNALEDEGVVFHEKHTTVKVPPGAA